MNNRDNTNTMISRDVNNNIYGNLRHYKPNRNYKIGFGATSQSVGIEDDTSSQIVSASLNGVTAENSNNGLLYFNIDKDNPAGSVLINIYKDAAKTEKVASGIAVYADTTTSVTITESNSSGISGTIILTTANIADDSGAANIFVVPLLETNIVELRASAACYIKFVEQTNNETATARDFYMAANDRIPDIHLRHVKKISVIQSSGSGTLYISEQE